MRPNSINVLGFHILHGVHYQQQQPLPLHQCNLHSMQRADTHCARLDGNALLALWSVNGVDIRRQAMRVWYHNAPSLAYLFTVSLYAKYRRNNTMKYDVWINRYHYTTWYRMAFCLRKKLDRVFRERISLVFGQLYKRRFAYLQTTSNTFRSRWERRELPAPEL